VGLEEELISPSRSYLFEGQLLKISDSKVDKRWFFLFTDCIIYAKPTKKGYLIFFSFFFFLSFFLSFLNSQISLLIRLLDFRGKWDLSSSYCKDIQNR